MAARLRAQVAALIADASNNLLNDNSQTSAINQVTSNLNRLASYDGNNNVTLSNVKNIITTNSVTVTSDASKNLLTDATGITFAQLKITTDSLGNIVFS
jgi:hypothetical protein